MNRQLQTLVDRANQRWPDSPITIARAARHVTENRVALVDAETDSWQVAGIACSFARNACQCRDHSIDPVGGKLRICEHMIAVMFAKRLAESQDADHVPAHMAGVVEFLNSCAGDDRSRLLVDITYNHRTRGTKGDRYRLSGYHRIDHRPQKLHHADHVDFTQDDLVRALWAAGWRLHQKTQGQFMTWRLILVPMTERDRHLDPPLATAIGVLDAVSAHVIERRQERAAMEQQHILHTGERFARNLVGVTA